MGAVMGGGSRRELGGTSVVQRVENALRDDLAYGRWRPGEKLPGELALARGLGVGRSSLREAIRVLSRERLLVVRHGAGTFVADPITPAEGAALAGGDGADPAQALRRARIAEVYQVRRALEIEAGRVAAEVATPADVGVLERLLERRQRVVGADTAVFVEADTDFHRGVVAISGNALLLALFDQIREPLSHALAALVDLEPLPSTAGEHAALVDAIRVGDPGAAARATSANFDVIFDLFRSSWD